MLPHRARAWLGSVPLPRLRRIILALFIVIAALDSAGKTLVSHPRINRALSRRVSGASAVDVRNAAKPSGNFEIFRLASRHLVSGEDMYADYPAEISDRYKYSPTFALLFAPLAWLWWPMALFLWSCLNALVLFVAVERVLPGRSGLLALGALLLEVLRGMQNAQSNALVAGLIVLSFVAMERTNAWRTAGAVMLGACVKIFPLAALSFAIPRRRVWQTGVWAAAIGATLVVLPLLVTSPATLLAQYAAAMVLGDAARAPVDWSVLAQLAHPAGRHARAAGTARAAPRSLGRRALSLRVPVLGADVRGAVQPPGGARELPHRVRGDHALVRGIGACAVAVVALRHRVHHDSADVDADSRVTLPGPQCGALPSRSTNARDLVGGAMGAVARHDKG
jgi:hypothetical protein